LLCSIGRCVCDTLCRHTHVQLASFTDAASTEIYTLSLHDALPIYAFLTKGPEAVDFFTSKTALKFDMPLTFPDYHAEAPGGTQGDRKSTRLNSSHVKISYAVFCLKKKKITHRTDEDTQDTKLYRTR